ncbi:E3 ubiquitin-protein ligase TRIM39-like isoform X2 [Pelodiscus sinensis]|uniref:E3 ubiquitin-protein ligase TRIM39-like isoform X2 n=1 Tax=Pelodiscus sinensis TaxID=13735 RepID=UPI003F6CA27D
MGRPTWGSSRGAALRRGRRAASSGPWAALGAGWLQPQKGRGLRRKGRGLSMLPRLPLGVAGLPGAARLAPPPSGRAGAALARARSLAAAATCRPPPPARGHGLQEGGFAAAAAEHSGAAPLLATAVNWSNPRETCSAAEVVKKKRERIVTEFEKLHRLLAEEEKQLLQKLEQEEKIILQRLHENLTRLLEQKFSLDKLILEIREKSQQSADMLLKDMKSTLSRCEAVTVQAPEACSVALRENYSIPEHCLGMRDMLKKFKVEVTLDPKTAHPELLLSDDRKSVSRGGKSLLLSLSDSHKRFNASPLVLGLQAFTAGRRYWEVQVGDKPEWGLGLCRESARRKGTVVLSPSNGFWVLRLHSQGKYEALTSPLTSLYLSVRPRRVGIFLDYEAGEITFYNVTDRDHIYTFTDQFAGPLRPLFCPGASMDSKNAEPLVISWVRETDGSGCILL